MKRLQWTAVFLIVLFCYGCAGRGKGLGPETLAFYHDELALTQLINEQDSPQRKASMRILAQAWDKRESGQLISDLEQALRIDARNPFAYYYLSFAYLDQGQFKESLVYSKQSQKRFRDPRWQGKALVLEARAHAELNQISEALSAYQEARQKDPINPLIKKGLDEVNH